jgi:lipopolysaccharide export system protein LptC
MRGALQRLVPGPRARAILVLLPLVAATGWVAWQLRPDPAPPDFVGPPRSDYQLSRYELVSLDEQGREAFSLTGPVLARDPLTGTLALEQPRFEFPVEGGDGRWVAEAEDGWVSERAEEVRLSREVDMRGPPREDGGAMRLRTERLTVRPRASTASSDAEVVLTDRGLVHRASSLEADLKARRVQLTNVRARHDPSR